MTSMGDPLPVRHPEERTPSERLEGRNLLDQGAWFEPRIKSGVAWGPLLTMTNTFAVLPLFVILRSGPSGPRLEGRTPLTGLSPKRDG